MWNEAVVNVTGPSMVNGSSSSTQQDYKVWASLLGGSCGSATAKTATAPLSRLTILYQVSSMGASKTVHSQDSIYRTMKNILEKEGITSMWRGNLVSVIHKFPYGAINYYVYEKAKILMRPYWSSPTDPGISCRFLAGFMGGCAANVATYPLDLVRTRLATNDTLRNWGIIPTLREIARTEGLSSLFKGLGVTIWCQGLNIALNFAIYETLQKWVFRQVLGMSSFNALEKQRGTWLSSLLCGAMAGSTASMIIFPLDLIRRRQQMCVGVAAPSFLTVARQIVKAESIRGLYRGLIPELIKVIPAVGINFYVYELVRQEVLGVEISPRVSLDRCPLPLLPRLVKHWDAMQILEGGSSKRQATGYDDDDDQQGRKDECPHDLVWQGMCATCCAIVDSAELGKGDAGPGHNAGSSSGVNAWKEDPLSLEDDDLSADDDDSEGPQEESVVDSDEERRAALEKGGYYATEFLSGDAGIRVSAAFAASLESSTIRTLASSKRLVAVLDIDHTILHVTNKRIDLLFPDVTCYNLAPNRDTGRLDEEKVYQFFIGTSPTTTACCYLKLRPGFYTFLEEILPLYELYLYTHGTREYAIRLLKALDPSARYFGSPPRLIARPTQSALTCKTLSRIFPSNHRLAVIVDDRDDVWEAKDNEHSLIKVTPYVFFPDSERLRVSLEGQLNAIIAAGAGKRAMAPLAEYHHPADASSSAVPTPPEEGAPPRDRKWLEMAESDRQLHYVTEMLRNIHTRTYAAAQLATGVGDELDATKLDVRPVIPAIREQTLEGLRVGHSGLVPSNYWDPAQHPVVRLLHRLGATVVTDIAGPRAGLDSSSRPPIDVLVASNTETRKAQQAMEMGVPVVHVWYLLHALATWQRPKFGPFKLSSIEATPMRVHWQAPQLYTKDPHDSEADASPARQRPNDLLTTVATVDSSSEEGFVGGLTVDEDDLLAALEGDSDSDDQGQG
ncbi:hypothetical protein Pmar_PMAR013688 [Perkinsus marinus ATCC 50983]|uniref:FCP1 homology domain-containing protein n=1 Tax=Perkinsus marinus (strain ATCC 50983 / TXsc) TaxID=423536 RepID=C5LY09_PERM5|nr:hypothetical protein Pmar_PMAR013688 [Perkinsus marinus ATCC 50983]EEQ98339.1 hypothetical protein Pmar_PMAR013688 [Perkinsus marinus ATCC 50983]|eukprot:XP_002765622.1 hypothetical protein Pmar_PMAR013688 [Perkinsus marinus ATCC 50983]